MFVSQGIDPQKDMERTDFEMYLGQTFEVISQEQAMTLQLVELHRIQASQIPGTRTDPFALLFRVGASADSVGTLPRQVHMMRRPDGEIFAIYLEPVMSPGKPGQVYEAVFN
jgi:hypothetical protein